MRPRSAGSMLAPDLEVVELLRRGNDLDVYDCIDHRRWCRVVVKRARPDRPRAAAMVRREAKLLGRLAHPHLARMLELRDDMLLLETLGGRTLGVLVAERRLSAGEASVLGQQLCGALAHMHGESVLHLDIKPSNVVEHAGAAKLLDLSIARPPGRGKRDLGTWCNAAPEQLAGEPVTAACDVWGLGLLLHEALTGEAVFDLPGPRPPAPRLRSLRPRMPRALDELLAACLEVDPRCRPALAELHAGLAT